MKQQINLRDLSTYRSELMGISISMIMFFHMLGLIAPNRLYPLFHNFDIGVEFFLAISAIGLYTSLSKNFGIAGFYKRRLIRLFPAYLAIGSLYYIGEKILYHHDWYYVFYNISFLSLIKDGKLVYWFVFEITLCYLLMPYLFRLIKMIGPRYYLLLSLVVMVVCYLLVEPFITIRIVLHRFPVFCFSLILAQQVFLGKVYPLKHILLATVLCLLVLLYARFSEDSFPLHIRAVYFFSFVPFLICLGHSMNYIGTRLKTMLRFLGSISLELYLIHESLFRFLRGHHIDLLSSIVLSLVASITIAYVLHYTLGIYILRRSSKILS